MDNDLIGTFTKQLTDMSYARAGWDYELTPAQRAEDNALERSALAQARAIWAENPDMQTALREAFARVSPLATMSEIAGE